MRVLLFALALGCGGPIPDQPKDLGKTDTRPTHELDEPDDEDIPPMGGNLPLGYYERQCQWDACGGPLPDRTNPAIDPNDSSFSK